MRLNLRGVVCQCILALGVAATLVTSASAQGGNIRSVTFYTVKPDRVGDFNAEITAYNALKLKGGSTEYASTWASLTGPRAFALVVYYNKWADLDAGPDPKMKEQATDLARISMRITDCTESWQRVIEEVNPDLSLPDSGKMPTMIRVLVTQVRPDKVKDYLELAKNEIIPGIKKSGLKDYTTPQRRFADPNPAITSLPPFNTPAHLAAHLAPHYGI